MNFKQLLIAGGAAAMLFSGAAKAAPLLNLEVLGSLTQNGTYSSNISAPAGTTIYYEVVAQFNPGATNTNTTKVPNGTADSINSIPEFTVTSSDTASTFGASSLQNGFGNGTGTHVNVNGNSAAVRAVNSAGVYANADAPLTIVSGQFTVGGNAPETITGSYTSTSGIFHVAGSNVVSASSTTETGADPILDYASVVRGDALTINAGDGSSVPAPSVTLGGAVFAAFAGLGWLAKRRQTLA